MSKFVWFEYVSGDAPKAQGFYGELFGWGTQRVPLPGAEYTMIAQGDTTIGGYLSAGAQQQAHWLSHLGVSDAKAAAQKAKSLGGTIVKDAAKVGEFGTKAVIADPAGGVLALWQPASSDDQGPAEGAYRFCWNELYAKDMKASVAFYRGISGLGEQAMDMGGQPYTMLVDGDVPVAGICPPPFDAPHAWQPVVVVPDAEASLAKAKKLGATILAPIEDVPTVGRFFVIADPLGAVLGILQRA